MYRRCRCCEEVASSSSSSIDCCCCTKPKFGPYCDPSFGCYPGTDKNNPTNDPAQFKCIEILSAPANLCTPKIFTTFDGCLFGRTEDGRGECDDPTSGTGGETFPFWPGDPSCVDRYNTYELEFKIPRLTPFTIDSMRTAAGPSMSVIEMNPITPFGCNADMILNFIEIENLGGGRDGLSWSGITHFKTATGDPLQDLGCNAEGWGLDVLQWKCYNPVSSDPYGKHGMYLCNLDPDDPSVPAWLIPGYPGEEEMHYKLTFQVRQDNCGCSNEICGCTNVPLCKNFCPSVQFLWAVGVASGITGLCYPDDPCKICTDEERQKFKGDCSHPDHPGHSPFDPSGKCCTFEEYCDNVGRKGNTLPDGTGFQCNQANCVDGQEGGVPGGFGEFKPSSYPVGVDTPSNINYMDLEAYAVKSTDSETSSKKINLTIHDQDSEERCAWQCREEDGDTFFELLESPCDCGSNYMSGPCYPGELVYTDCN